MSYRIQVLDRLISMHCLTRASDECLDLDGSVSEVIQAHHRNRLETWPLNVLHSARAFSDNCKGD